MKRLVALDPRIVARRDLVGVAGLDLARRLVALSPFRESGHALLMRVLAARGNFAEALRAYEDLRIRLDELGIAPGSEAQEINDDLLTRV